MVEQKCELFVIVVVVEILWLKQADPKTRKIQEHILTMKQKSY